MAIDSRGKGIKGELEFAKFLTEAGFPAIRGQQHRGGPGSPDVICESLSGIHWEVKRVQKLHLEKAMEQAQQDADLDQIPIVAHRANNQAWMVTLPLMDFLDMLRRVYAQDDSQTNS